MNMTEKMKLLQGRGLAPDSFEQPTRPDKLVRTDTYSSYRSVAEKPATWSKTANAQLGRSSGGAENDAG